MAFIQLTGPQAVKIQKTLVAAFPLEASFKEVVLFANHVLDQVSGAGQPLTTRVLETIKHAEANNWLNQLLSMAADMVPADEALRDLRDEMRAQAPPDDLSPYYMCRLGAGTVMVNRKKLREAVEELHDLQGRRIFVIRGDSRSGKSHSLQLITFISQFVGGFTIVPVDLDPHRDDQERRVIGARDLASRLVTLSDYKIALPEDPKDLQWSKWVTTFGDSFATEAAKHEGIRWIVIDSMNKVLLDQPAVDLVQDLVTRVFKTLPRLRLVLVGYDQSLPPLILPYIQEEKIERISDKELVEFFVLAYREMKRAASDEAVSEAVTEAVSRILEQVDMQSGDYLLKLGPLAAQEILKLKGGAP